VNAEAMTRVGSQWEEEEEEEKEEEEEEEEEEKKTMNLSMQVCQLIFRNLKTSTLSMYVCMYEC
jgi:CO dehydrogenase/acetyl-CoA synthase beta subunit